MTYGGAEPSAARAPAPFRFDLVTLFPELFAGPLATGLLGRALREGLAEVRYVDPRRFTEDRHRTVDDAPYGGGAGMVMKVEPLARAIRVVRARGPGPVVLLTPQGRPLAQSDLARWAAGAHLGLVSGRYEGFDERVRGLVDEEISLGDFVLTGGEYAALAIVDGVVRLRPGTLGNVASAPADSFFEGLLEHPQYTRPERYEEEAVPEVLLGGHHARVTAWRRAEQLLRTRDRRPDLLEGLSLTRADRQVLAAVPPARRLALAVAFSDPEPSEEMVARVARLSDAYALTEAWLVGPGCRARVEAAAPVAHGLLGGREKGPRSELETWPRHRLRCADDWAAFCAGSAEGRWLLAADRGLDDDPPNPLPVVTPAAARVAAQAGPGVVLVLGPAARSAPPEGPGAHARLPGLRQSTERSRLDALTAAALLLDRVLSEG